MTFKPSISFLAIALCAGTLFGLGRAELRFHRKAVSASRQPGLNEEPGLNLAGMIGPTITAPIIARNLRLTVPINAAVKKGDVIGAEMSPVDPTDVARARQDLENADSAQRQAADAVRQIEEQLTSIQSQISSMDREEVLAGTAEFDAEREYERSGRLLRSGLLSRSDYNTAVTARASAEAAIDSVRSNLSEASIDTDELEVGALEAKIELREATARRTAAAMVLKRMRGGTETKPIVSPADGFLVASAAPDATSFGISSDGQLFAYAMVREADLMKVWVGQEASIVLDAQPAASFAAHVITIAETPVDLPDGPSYQLTFAVENQGDSWLAGVAMHVHLAGLRTSRR